MKENFNDPDNRYSRQVLFGPIGKNGQEMLARSSAVINTAVNIIASIQTTEALKFLTGNSDDMIKGLINIDVWDLSLDIIDIKKDKGNRCPVCGTG